MFSKMPYIFLLPVLLLLGCKKAEFKLEFSLDKDVTENYNVTYYATDHNGEGITVQAVASVRDGKCELTGVTRYPTLAYISTKKNPLPLVIYARRGSDIKISGEGTLQWKWDVSGDEINTQLTSWRLKNESFLTKNNTDSINYAVKDFVLGNPENPVSAILMLCYFTRGCHERTYTELMTSLKGEAHDADWLKTAARSDQMIHSYSYPAKLRSLIMRASENKVDTLLTDDKSPVMIFFWQTGYTQRQQLLDSLKALEKEVPDSMKIIADICLDVDSIAWRNAIRKDSLTDVKRFWTPLGLNDPAITKLKVMAMPYFIVFDKEGSQDYRGSDIGAAMKAYRNLLDPNDSL